MRSRFTAGTRALGIGIITLISMASAAPAFAREIVVNVDDKAALTAAMTRAAAGDVIVLADGTWKDAAIDFNAAAGTASAPITLRARTPGKVRLTGGSRLTFSKPYLVVEGLLFADGMSPGGAVVEFRSDHGRLTASAIVEYNPPSTDTAYPWVAFYGSDNRVDHCYFHGKSNENPVITNRGAGFRRNRVETSYFKDVPHRDRNGREIIQIVGYGSSEEMGDDGAFFLVEKNLFEEAHGEGMEIISIKSNRNIVRGNTFRKTKGGITNRSGNFNTIDGNIILGEKEPGSYGIRVTGQHQRVVNNYVADVDGAGLLLVAGEYIDKAITPAYQPIARKGTPLGRVPRYAQVQHGVFAHNVFLNCGGPGIEVGSAYKAGWPEHQRMLMPARNRIEDNVIRRDAGTAGADVARVLVTEPDRTPPLDAFTFEPNTYVNNLVVGGLVKGVSDEGFSAADRPSRKPQPLEAKDVGPAWMQARGSQSQ